MTTMHQLRERLNEAWDTLVEGWQRLYRRAAGAITRSNPGEQDNRQDKARKARDIAVGSAGWGVLRVELTKLDSRPRRTIRVDVD